ncbi:uncharacterized protein zmp:0000001127 [Sardina pilchardus]|uniref:uncharacterized protein zmp:0000001127 n=1 Tax=Sardina pilchardus TaxID=27697 RepID=UPI002E0F5A31
MVQDELFKGLNCSEQSMELNVRTQTLSVCAPQNTSCSGHKFTFDRVSGHPDDTFDERMRLCRTLKGFRARTIIISRVIRYILNKV